MTGLTVAFASSVVPFALGGDSSSEAGGNGTAIAVVSLLSIAIAYVLLFVLWRYVFSAKARTRRRGRRD